MAERRMFAKAIIDSDAFLDMPLSAQSLYFHLSMRADDDGFVNNPKKIQRMIGASEDDCKLLLLKSFIIPFETGVCVIKHWKIHNYIRTDRYKETVYQDEKQRLTLENNGTYSLNQMDNSCVGIPPDNRVVYQMETQVRLGKDRLGKDSNYMLGAETPPNQHTAFSLPLNDSTVFDISQNQLDTWCDLYPAVDVIQELRKMKGWLDANPTKRKTKKGIMRFCNSWLSREQDRGGNNGNSGSSTSNSSSPRNLSGGTRV